MRDREFMTLDDKQLEGTRGGFVGGPTATGVNPESYGVGRWIRAVLDNCDKKKTYSGPDNKPDQQIA